MEKRVTEEALRVGKERKASEGRPFSLPRLWVSVEYQIRQQGASSVIALQCSLPVSKAMVPV